MKSAEGHVKIILEDDPEVRGVLNHFYSRDIGIQGMLIGREEYIEIAYRYLGIPKEKIRGIVNFLVDARLVESYLRKSKGYQKML